MSQVEKAEEKTSPRTRKGRRKLAASSWEEMVSRSAWRWESGGINLSSGRIFLFPFQPAEPLDFIRLSRSRIFSPLALAFASEFYLENAHVCVELSLLLPGFINSTLSYLTYTTLFVVYGFWLLDFFELELCFCRDMNPPLAHASPSFLPFGSLKLRSQPIFLLISKIWPRLRRNYFGFSYPSKHTETLWLLLVWKALRWEEHQAIILLANRNPASSTCSQSVSHVLKTS